MPISCVFHPISESQVSGPSELLHWYLSQDPLSPVWLPHLPESSCLRLSVSSYSGKLIVS